MKKLKINHRTKKLCALVDDAVYDELKQYKWFVNTDLYVWRYDYSLGWQKPAKLYLHRYLLSAPKGVTVDHKDRNPLNNQTSNLRVATYAQQNINTKTRVDNTSGHRGVYWENRRNCWRVCINFNKKQIHIGQFKDKTLAIRAYKLKAQELYGEFAN